MNITIREFRNLLTDLDVGETVDELRDFLFEQELQDQIIDEKIEIKLKKEINYTVFRSVK